MKHFLRCVRQAASHPRAAWLGAREFRLDLTTSYEDYGHLESYDSGREIAHIVTLRSFDKA